MDDAYKKGYQAGYLSAGTENPADEANIGVEDDREVDGYNDGFAARCEELGKSIEETVARIDAKRSKSKE